MAGTDKAAELYAFVKEYAQLKLEAETKRYESLIQQASNMQAAFSFSTAALFMVAAIVIEYRGKLSLTYFRINHFLFDAESLLLCVGSKQRSNQRFCRCWRIQKIC